MQGIPAAFIVLKGVCCIKNMVFESLQMWNAMNCGNISDLAHKVFFLTLSSISLLIKDGFIDTCHI